jgi:hypothetical protein
LNLQIQKVDGWSRVAHKVLSPFPGIGSPVPEKHMLSSYSVDFTSNIKNRNRFETKKSRLG